MAPQRNRDTVKHKYSEPLPRYGKAVRFFKQLFYADFVNTLENLEKCVII